MILLDVSFPKKLLSTDMPTIVCSPSIYSSDLMSIFVLAELTDPIVAAQRAHPAHGAVRLAGMYMPGLWLWGVGCPGAGGLQSGGSLNDAGDWASGEDRAGV